MATERSNDVRLELRSGKLAKLSRQMAQFSVLGKNMFLLGRGAVQRKFKILLH